MQDGDTLTTIAAGLAAAITTVSSNISTYTTSTSGGATETLTPGIYANGTYNGTIGGAKTTGDVLTITVFDAGPPGGQQAITCTVQPPDTLTSIATGLKTAINANANLQALGVTATCASSVVNIKSASSNVTNYVSSTSSDATETITLAVNLNVVQIAAIGGTKTTGDVLTITVFDSALPGGSKAVSYTVQASDTLTSIASGSATTAVHMACCLSHGTMVEGKPPLRAEALVSNISFLTAVANDHGYDHVFEYQLRNCLSPDDIFIAISCSGNSPNVVAGAEYARESGGHTIGLLGFTGGKLLQICHQSLYIENYNYGHVESAHVFISHLLSQYLKQRITDAVEKRRPPFTLGRNFVQMCLISTV